MTKHPYCAKCQGFDNTLILGLCETHRAEAQTEVSTEGR